jgi:hypothetical protein
MDDKRDKKWETLILRRLYDHPGHEAILIPSMFTPPILLSNIMRIGNELSKKGLISAPDRRMGGWHMKLLADGIAACQGGTAGVNGQGPKMR